MLDFRQALCQKSEEAPGGFKSLEFEGVKKEAGLITITAALRLPPPSALYTLYINRQISNAPRNQKHTFSMKTRAENHTFLKKAVFYPYKTWILPHKPHLLVKAIFMANRKGLLRDWKTLMTDNSLDLNDLNDLIP